MRIASFISNHGFGHIMRNLPVMEELANRGHDILLITGEKQSSVVKDERIRKTIADTDAGLIVKPGTIFLDEIKTKERIKEHVSKWSELIDSAPDADIYVVDIVPWALLAARKKRIPSFLMASFTWVEQYEAFLEKYLLDQYKEAFYSADHILYYDLANTPTRELLGDGIDVGFVARPINEDEVKEIRAKHHNPIIYLSLGGSNDGLDEEIDVESLPFDFVTTSALNLVGSNVERLGVGVDNTQDYVAAADYCISKAGWSTVSEMMISCTRFAVLNRPDVPEDTMIIEELEKRKAGFGINTKELQNMNLVIERLKNYKKAEQSYSNNYRLVADIIEGKVNEL